MNSVLEFFVRLDNRIMRLFDAVVLWFWNVFGINRSTLYYNLIIFSTVVDQIPDFLKRDFIGMGVGLLVTCFIMLAFHHNFGRYTIEQQNMNAMAYRTLSLGIVVRTIFLFLYLFFIISTPTIFGKIASLCFYGSLALLGAFIPTTPRKKREPKVVGKLAFE
jgi:hypothetical protein